MEPIERLQEQINREQQIDKEIAQDVAQKAKGLSAEEEKGLAPTDEERKRTHRLNNDSLETDIGLKKKYGYGLIILMVAQLIVMNGVFIAVGRNQLHYSDYTIHLYIAGTLLELFGLVLVITKYLFRK